MTEPLLTAEDVAALIGMSVDWVYAETRAGRIPHVPLGRYYRYRRASIEQWIAELEAATLAGTTKRRGAAATAPGMAHEEYTS